MERIEVEALNGQHNYAVIKLPGREYPGVLFQGDSLSILVHDLLEARTALGRGETDTAGEELDDVIESLKEIKSSYEQALLAHDINRPYS